MVLPEYHSELEKKKFVETSAGDVAVRVFIASEDLQIGAVEIKDATTNDRARVLSSEPGGSDFGLVVRHAGVALVEGDISENTVEVDANHPVKIGGKASAAVPSQVSDGVRVNAFFDLSGRQAVTGQVPIGSSILAVNPITVAFKDAANNAVVPTGINAGGFDIMGIVPLDLSAHIQDFTPAGEVYSFVASADNTKTNVAYLKVDSSQRLLTGVRSSNTLLDNVNTTYNDVTTTASSTGIDCTQFTKAKLSFRITKSGSPTRMQIDVETSDDGGTNWEKMTDDALGAIIYSNASIGSAGKFHSYTFEIAASLIRVTAKATGTTATNTITIDNMRFYLRNEG